MKRNIITTIFFSSGQVTINVLERLQNNVIEIFNDVSSIKRVNSFIESSLSHIEKLIGGNISKATFVIEPSIKVGQKISLRKDSISINGATVAKIDIDNLINLVKQDFDKNERKTILVQPLKFDVQDVMTKSYSRAPIHKRGSKLTMTSSVTTISEEAFEYINQVAKAADIEIAEILLSNQTTTFAHLSKNVLAEGSILFNISMNQVNITVNRNNAIVASMTFYDYGYKSLIKGIMTQLSCSKDIARNLVAAHGSFTNNINRVIHSERIGTDSKSYTNVDLMKIINYYLYKLTATIKKYIEQMNIGNLPIFFSGELAKFEGIEQKMSSLFEKQVSAFKGLTYVERNWNNVHTIGTINFIDIMNLVLGKKYDTIVNTNPNAIPNIKSKSNKGWFAKMKDKIGWKYDWK